MKQGSYVYMINFVLQDVDYHLDMMVPLNSLCLIHESFFCSG